MTKSRDIIGGFERYVVPSYARFPIALVEERHKVWDADGKVYLDFLGGIAVNALGHSHQKSRRQYVDRRKRWSMFPTFTITPNQAELAKELSELSLGGKCFCNSGAEANEALIKLARLWGNASGKHEIVCMENSFHGRTLATLAATGQAKYRAGFDPMPGGFVHARFNDIDSVRAAITERTAAVLVEAVQGEGGVLPSAPGFLQSLRALCDEKNILLLFDEVQCGMGRTGHWFGFQADDVKPDAFSLAKALGNSPHRRAGHKPQTCRRASTRQTCKHLWRHAACLRSRTGRDKNHPRRTPRPRPGQQAPVSKPASRRLQSAMST